ncbi:isoleucine--tRNA ligase [Candidatus Pacearchaeota archaeon]|nr:isoleucine--tRNA ligase [Candidatus Pacearchaeota archaeon]
MYNFTEIEKETLEFWEKNKIFEKLQKKNKGKMKWSFIDGPITANNPMGVHHAWGRTYKDLFQRFKAMQGFDQRYQNGFDCQGLWIEREEEKELGLKSKKDIEKFGILKFVQACRKRIEKFTKIQTEQSIKLGQWMNWDNSYYTMTDNNNLHNWHLLKEYFNKGWLYKGKDAVPWCWRCGTASSKHDIATEGYKEVSHKALFMRFPVKEEENTYFLIFTTTPWTVPANVAIAVNENLNYVKVENDEKYYWMAESRLSELKGECNIVANKTGKELEGIEYEMPYENLEEQTKTKTKHKVVTWELASGEEGTGIVHIAPGCGAEDYDLGMKLKLPKISPLNEEAIFMNGFGDFSGKKYDHVNKEVLRDLEERGFAYKIEPYRHRYPHCWRCGEELVFRLVDEWYIKCSNEIRQNLIKENKKIKWFPEYGKTRQEDWFNNMGDWLISRKRYWGLPLPIWECSCGNIEVIGSLEELKEKAIDKKLVDKLPELHRPWIDEIKIKCSKCKKETSRVLDVGDAWLDAGIVMFSTLNYLTDKKYWQEWYPAEFICENMPGQFRGWFNAIMWAGIMLTGKAPFKSILGYETLKDEKGEEMHKSKGNAIWFDDAVAKVGADSLRLVYSTQDPTQELKFGFNVLKEPQNNINILYNLSKLIEGSKEKEMKLNKLTNVEDKWILSKLNSLIKKVTAELDDLHPHLATKALQDFWLNNLSRGYIQLVRDRIAEDDQEAKYVLRKVYLELIKLCAPIMPFVTDNIWQSLRQKKIVEEESVHLCEWPKPDQKQIDEKLELDMQNVFDIVVVGLAERDKAKIGLKWPLAKATISTNEKIDKSFEEIIQRQLNVKKVEITTKAGMKEINVELDTKLTPELEAEGFTRELTRAIQAERKNNSLVKEQKIELLIGIPKELKMGIEKNKNELIEKVNSIKFSTADTEKIDAKTRKNYNIQSIKDIKGKKFEILFNIL